MAPPNPKALKLAINKNGKKKVHFALEGDSFDPANCTLIVRREGESESWECDVIRKKPLPTLLPGWFRYKLKADADEKGDDKDTEDLEFIITNPGSPPVTFPVPVTVVDDTPELAGD
jgi:hypothetical protein